MSVPCDPRALERSEPLYLAIITLGGAGAPVLHLSEQDIEVEETFYHGYLGQVEGVGSSLDRLCAVPAGKAARLWFLNLPWRGHSSLAEALEENPLDGAGLVLKETYIDPEGAPAMPVPVLKGIMGGPAGMDLTGFYADVTGMVSRADI